MIVHIENEKDFEKIIANGKVVVDFYATWCGPCRMLSPVLESIANQKEELVIAKLDVDQVSQVASRYSIASIPTLLFFKDGTLVHEQVGFLPEKQLMHTIQTYLE